MAEGRINPLARLLGWYERRLSLRGPRSQYHVVPLFGIGVTCRGYPRMALMTSSTLATHAMRGNTRSIQVSCSFTVAAAQQSRTTTQS
jgi:hypothetical protein